MNSRPTIAVLERLTMAPSHFYAPLLLCFPSMALSGVMDNLKDKCTEVILCGVVFPFSSPELLARATLVWEAAIVKLVSPAARICCIENTF